VSDHGPEEPFEPERDDETEADEQEQEPNAESDEPIQGA